MNCGWKFWVDHQPWNGNGHTLRILKHYGPRKCKQALVKFEMVDSPEGSEVPIVEVHSREEESDDIRSFLQAALDAAWEAGLRPAAYEDNRLEVTTLKGWLEDMRVLAKVKKA